MRRFRVIVTGVKEMPPEEDKVLLRQAVVRRLAMRGVTLAPEPIFAECLMSTPAGLEFVLEVEGI